jgi:hypothetical protein
MRNYGRLLGSLTLSGYEGVAPCALEHDGFVSGGVRGVRNSGNLFLHIPRGSYWVAWTVEHKDGLQS